MPRFPVVRKRFNVPALQHPPDVQRRLPGRLRHFEGKAVLVVNVASKCGFTRQYSGLEELYGKYRDRGFEILGVPCNQFAGQEQGSDAEIADFCQRNFGVSFPLASKAKVRGKQQHPCTPS